MRSKKLDRVEAEFFGVTIASYATSIAIYRGVCDNLRSFQLVIVKEMNVSYDRRRFLGYGEG
jgi:hypothetical protein